MKRNLGLLILMALLLPGLGAAGDLTFNYQGRIKSNGVPFDGTGNFKFAIYVKDSSTDRMLWYNDGFTTQSEPVNAVAVPVVNGVFNVVIGDTTIPNMAPLDPVIFNVDGPLFLRTWFSDGTDGYEVLSPDSRISNPDLLGRRQSGILDLYVDAATGNDRWAGLRPGKPKQTIQAAVDALPPVIKGQVIIHVDDGFYPESVRFQNIQLSGRTASLTLRGNPGDPSSVRVSGSDSPTTSPTTRPRGIEILNQAEAITIEGIQVDSCSEYGVFVDRSSVVFSDTIIQNCTYMAVNVQGASSVTFNDSKILHCDRGVFSTAASGTSFHNSEIAYMTYMGVLASYGGQGYLFDSTVHDTGQPNVWASTGGSLLLTGSELYRGGMSLTGAYYGVRAEANSAVRFIGGNVHDQGVGGVLAMTNSMVFFYGALTTIQNCPVGLDAHSASLIHNSDGAFVSFSGNGQDVLTDGGGSYLTTNY